LTGQAEIKSYLEAEKEEASGAQKRAPTKG